MICGSQQRHSDTKADSTCSQSEPMLTIILPSLVCDAQYLRCISAIRAAMLNKVKYEIISVVKEVAAFFDITSEDLHILPEVRPGIYAAMNVGLSYAKGTYVYFLGQDDIMLPQFADVFTKGANQMADIILANVFWGTGVVYKNHQSPYSLVRRNWCHQGVIYKRKLFKEFSIEFPEEYSSQADHYVNIRFVGVKKSVHKYSECIAWYSAGGFSSRNCDLVFRNRFPFLVLDNFGFLFFFIVVVRRKSLYLVRKFLNK